MNGGDATEEPDRIEPAAGFDDLDEETLALLLRRLRRVEGQIRGLQQMLTDDRSCSDVITQLGAARKALQQTGFLLVADRLHHCATDSRANGATMDDVEQLFAELR
jgi:DNA-binding FrmR family transcriptional regulator